MSALNFIIDMSQEGRLGTHDEQITELRAIVYNLHKWVVHLNNELETLKITHAADMMSDKGYTECRLNDQRWIAERERQRAVWSDILSDGGMDPRNKNDEQKKA